MELNKVYVENCLETMARMPDGFIDLTVTSPPYDNLRAYKGYSFDFEAVAKELFRVTKNGGLVVWVVGDATISGSETGTSFKQALYFMECGFKLHDTMIYQKNKAPGTAVRYQDCFEYMFVFAKGLLRVFNPIKVRSLKAGTKKLTAHRGKDGTKEIRAIKNRTVKDLRLIDNIWYYYAGNNEGDAVAEQHPARFPEQLAADHIHSWSNAGDLIYDPFGGSGTTGKMAMLMNRNYILSEISHEYAAIAEKRIALHASQFQIKYA